MEKKKSPLRKILKVFAVMIAVIIGILLILCIIFHRQVSLGIEFFNRAHFIDQNTEYTTLDTTLTMEQRLKDFDYMYDIVCLQNPEKEYLEQQFGISYQDIHDCYRAQVLETKDEFEYFSLLTSFLSVLPGQHNAMLLPDYDKFVVNGSYALLERLWTQDVKDHVNTWRDAFRDNVFSYDQRGLVFKYIDGAYYATVLPERCENMTEYEGARLLSLDGKNIDDMVFDIYERYVPTYDSEYDKFFRQALIFNEGSGEKYKAELQMPDGKTLTIDLYDDPGFDLAVVDRNKVYSDSADTSSEADESDAASEKPVSYFIAEDADRKLVYIKHDSCLAAEADRLAADIQTALTNVDAEYIILDIRDNKGGNSDMIYTSVCPVLFKDDLSYKAEIRLPDNELSEYFADSPLNYIGNLSRFRKKDGYITYSEDFSVDGKAEKEYKIYVLVSPNTFSSGDLMTRLAKEYPNATVIGSNTGGEGICGALFNDCLPESRFVFSYAPSLNTAHPEDSVYGTEPDIHMNMLKEYYDKRKEYAEQGIDVNTYEGRQLWDGILINTLAIIDEQR